MALSSLISPPPQKSLHLPARSQSPYLVASGPLLASSAFSTAAALGVFFSQPFSVRSSNFSSVSLLWRDKKSTGEPCSLLLLLNALVQEVQAQLEGCFSALGRDSSRAASATEEPSLPKSFDRSLPM